MFLPLHLKDQDVSGLDYLCLRKQRSLALGMEGCRTKALQLSQNHQSPNCRGLAGCPAHQSTWQQDDEV